MPVINQATGKNWALMHGDACELVKELPDNSIDFCIHSPPFSSLYIYSDSEADMGNCVDHEEFFEHYSFLIRELYRVMVTGRLVAVHCKDLPKYANRDGTSGLFDFPGMCIEAFCGSEAKEIWDAIRAIDKRVRNAARKEQSNRLADLCHARDILYEDILRVPPGEDCFSFHSRVTIWKCPVVERERTNCNGLLHKTVKRDRSQVRNGMADYLIVLRKPPVGTLMSDKPIVSSGFDQYVGDDDPRTTENPHPSKYARTGRLTAQSLNESEVESLAKAISADFESYDAAKEEAIQRLKQEQQDANDSVTIWRRYAEPVWWDINQTDVLNAKIARSDEDERHICPLQICLIKRAVQLWSAPGDVVLSPFAGVGSEGVGALQMGRKFIGFELKESYYEHAQSFLRQAENESNSVQLLPGFDE